LWTTRQEAFFSEDEDEEDDVEDFSEEDADDFSVDVDADDFSVEEDDVVAGVDVVAADLLSERLSVR
jgi:hypothetical protein